MPELPEVETVKNILSKIVIGQKITSIDVLRKNIIQGDEKGFVSSLVGEKILGLSRRGKFLFFHLSNDKVIISHLRMEGKYYDYEEKEDNSKYARVVFHFANNRKLCYDDSRSFGLMKLSSEANYLKEKEIAKLGPEPFEVKDVTPLLNKCKRNKTSIKTALLDQTLITGLGNIYVDEVLYASNIHPWTPANKVTKKEWEKIIKNSVEILNIAIEMGGSTIKSYHPGKDIDGNFQTRIKIYGKEGNICPHCGKTFRFVKTNGRGTTFCPSCQQKIGAPINVAITGKIASGKSTLTNLFVKNGYVAIDSDAIVASLYKKEEIIVKIEKMLGIAFKNKENIKEELRLDLLKEPKHIRKINNLIHPLVEKEIRLFLSTSKSPIRVVEVPLLFESKLDRLFEVIIAVDISEDRQLELLKARNNNKALELLKINQNNKFEENKNKATYLISNNGSEASFIKDGQNIINKLKDHLD